MQVMGIKGLKWLWLSGLVLLIDQASKLTVEAYFQLHEYLPVIPGLNLVLAYNPGAAFSWLADAGGWQRWFFTFVAFAVTALLLYWLVRLPASDKRNAAAYSLIIGGAWGNVIDRLVYGHVIDFIDVYYRTYHWPAFNIADSAICIGAALLVLDVVFSSKRDQVSSETKS